jgi:hypothetical protein
VAESLCPVIYRRLTEWGDVTHCGARPSGLELTQGCDVMTGSGTQMNRFERTLFRIALVLAGTLITVRVGAMLLTWYLHHIR